MPTLPFKAGSYTAIDRLASGGMADLFLACMQHEGTTRLAVIKLIQDDHASDADFAKMFHSEVQLSSWLNHPNIVQIYDFGKVEEAPYLAMEYIEGCSLREIMNHTREESEKIPVEIVLLIAEQALLALSYAHEFCHPISKAPLGLVHRDVTPVNILLTYEGVVKLIDFGIAKVTTKSSSTRTGLIKGKVRYFSPEQLKMEPLDRRSDLFALGIVLWEMLCGRTLFDGKTAPDVSAQLRDSDRVVQMPSKLRADVPKELDYLILKALASSPERRFASARDFHREVRALIQSRYAGLEGRELRSYVDSVFREKKITDAQRVARAVGLRNAPALPAGAEEESATEFIGGEAAELVSRWKPFIQFSPIVHGEAPTVGSGCTPVAEVLETLSWTGQLSTLRKALPSVTRDEILACLAYAADILRAKR